MAINCDRLRIISIHQPRIKHLSYITFQPVVSLFRPRSILKQDEAYLEQSWFGILLGLAGRCRGCGAAELSDGMRKIERIVLSGY